MRQEETIVDGRSGFQSERRAFGVKHFRFSIEDRLSFYRRACMQWFSIPRLRSE